MFKLVSYIFSIHKGMESKYQANKDIFDRDEIISKLVYRGIKDLKDSLNAGTIDYALEIIFSGFKGYDNFSNSELLEAYEVVFEES